MTSLRINRPTAAFISAGALLLAALAVAPQADAATLYACAKKDGQAHIYSKKPRCKKGETKLSWNTAGVSGRNGANGTNGKEGKEGAAGRNGLNGAVAGYFATNTAFAKITGLEEVTLVAKSIPAGNYIVFAKTVISASAEASTRVGAACELTDTGSGVLDRSQWAGGLVEFLPKVWIGKAAVSLVGAVSTKETTTLFLECTDQSNDINKLNIGGTFSQITAVQTTQNS
jgi:hypothetical protein